MLFKLIWSEYMAVYNIGVSNDYLRRGLQSRLAETWSVNVKTFCYVLTERD